MKFGKYIAAALLVSIACSGCSENREQHFLFNPYPIPEMDFTEIEKAKWNAVISTDAVTITQTSTEMTYTSPVTEVTVVSSDITPFETGLNTEPSDDLTDDYIVQEEAISSVSSLYEVTDYERTLMMHTVFHEAGNQSFECKKAVASVILNRAVLYDKTVTEVLFEPNQFTIDFSYVYYDEESESAVDEVLSYGTTIPYDVEFFFADYCWDDFLRSRVVYTQIDDTIFAY